MIREELVRRSPLRILERSIRGGVGKGTIGVIAGVKGVGKTACLVHIATDDLLQGKHVIHVSFAKETGHILGWYEDIFREIARRVGLDDATEIHDETVRNRVIMNFRQDGVHWPRIESRIRTLMTSGHFSADAIVVDGFDFGTATAEELAGVRRFAGEMGLEFWFSASLPPSPPAGGPIAIPRELGRFAAEIAVIIVMVDKGPFIHLELVKDHDLDCSTDLHLKLDPRILLIAEDE